MSVRAVLFDVDDTLVDTRGAFRHALAQIARLHLPEAPDADELTHFWRADRHGRYRAHTRGEIDYRSQRMLRANDLHGEFGGALMDDHAYDAWNADFERYFQEGWRALDDAAAALDELDTRGIPYGGLSNAAFAYQEQKLAACGLARVPMVVGVDTLGFGKPDPRIFALGAERMGLRPEEIAYVGDEYDIDAVAATEAGMVGIWLDRPGGHPVDVSHPAIRRIASLAELAGVLAPG